MQIIDTTVEVDLQDRASVEAYWDSKLVRALYFDPKRVSRGVRDAALANQAFARRLKEAAGLDESRSLAARCSCMIDKFATDTGFAAGNQTLYLVLGCATTTIYTVGVGGEEVSVLCVDSLGGSERTLTLYLAHEFTHYARKALLKSDIFKSCVGERLVTEGIAESYSKDMVADARDAECCIVDEDTVAWVDEHRAALDAYIRGGLESTELMEPLFYMFANVDFPVRTGYVYGYRAVRDYLKRHRLRTKDILGIDWRRVLDPV
ncbi:MAG: DUF2268 domain-containing putative Zn-dependent protease [Coriobacteriales bacterium]|nr:DUF2268 domain-containing putative Zn-dependent protease [Coriobacteriales bacterium]